MKSTSSLEELRAKLAKALQRDTPDFGKILELSSELAELDTENVRFTADAGLINRLGLQLVARQETAVSELVKNAYDADATEVKLVFSGSEKAGGRLLVEDNGNGMTRSQLIDGFMRLASQDKVHNPISPVFKRPRAGRKGIGRFAAQRLGRELLLVTQTASSKNAFEVRIDWRRFDSEQDLFTIANRIQEVPKRKPKGTLLIIDGLREPWTDSQIARVYRYVDALLQPSGLRPKGAHKDSKKKGFTASFFRLVGVKEMPVASEETMVYSHALADVSGRVDGDGKGFWRLKSTRLKIDKEVRISAKDGKLSSFKHLRNVKFAAKYFILSPEFVPPQALPRLRQLAETSGGIRLYRNGFRVLPYGEPNDDWLGLNEEYRRRGILVPLANNNWFGYVEVHDRTGTKFDETSSREGLAQNTAFDELVRFVSESLKAAALRVGSLRGRKGRASQRNYRRKDRGTPAQQIAAAAEELEKLATKLGRKTHRKVKDSTADVLQRVLTQLHDTATQSKEQLEENDMLRILASLGLTIGIFTHEVRLRLVDLRHDLQTLLEQRSLGPTAKTALGSMNEHFEIIRAYTAYFDAMISANVQRERKSEEVGWILHNFIRHFEPVATRDHIRFSDCDIESGLYTVPLHVSEWASILTNLFTNSRKAILRCDSLTGGKISFRARRDADQIIVDFADNGDGIPKENEERIFDAFFTTTHSAEHVADRDLSGTGLGLKIVRDIVSAAGGEIYVAPPPEGYTTCLRFELPVGEEPTE